jgi:predicted dehydrogenase
MPVSVAPVPAVTKVRWGILGVANISVKEVIPALQRGSRSEVVAIASRDAARARAAAATLGIARAYGSYQELLDDPDVEAVYNPLPKPCADAAACRFRWKTPSATWP